MNCEFKNDTLKVTGTPHHYTEKISDVGFIFFSVVLSEATKLKLFDALKADLFPEVPPAFSSEPPQGAPDSLETFTVESVPELTMRGHVKLSGPVSTLSEDALGEGEDSSLEYRNPIVNNTPDMHVAPGLNMVPASVSQADGVSE